MSEAQKQSSDNYTKSRNIKIKIEDNIYSVDRCILEASDFFNAMLNGKYMESKQDIITIDDITKKEWEIMIELLYLIMTKTYISYCKNINEFNKYNDIGYYVEISDYIKN